MLRCWPGRLQWNAATQAGLTAVLILFLALLIEGSGARAAQPAYILAARFQNEYRIEISFRVNGAGPFWCTLDSGAGGDFLVDSALAKAAGLHPTGWGRSFGEGPVSIVVQIAYDTTLQVDKLLLSHQRVRMQSLQGEKCIFGTKLLDGFIVEIDYLTPEIRLLAPEHYSPPTRAVTLPLEFDGSRRPIVRARLVLQPGDAILSHLLLDTAVADQVLSLSKVFTDKEQILKRVRNVIQLPFRANGDIELSATRIASQSAPLASTTRF